MKVPSFVLDEIAFSHAELVHNLVVFFHAWFMLKAQSETMGKCVASSCVVVTVISGFGGIIDSHLCLGYLLFKLLQLTVH